MEHDFTTPEGLIIGALSLIAVLLGFASLVILPILFIVSLAKYFKKFESGWLAALIATAFPTASFISLIGIGIYAYVSDYEPIIRSFDEIEGKRVISATKAGIRATLPEGWKQMQQLNELAVLQAGSVEDDCYAVVFQVKKADLVDDSELIHVQDNSNIQLLDRLYNSELIENEPRIINDKNAYQAAITGDMDGIKLYYLNVVIEGRDDFVQIMAWTSASGRDANSESLQSFIDSVRINVD